MRTITPFSPLSMHLHLAEEVLYDLPPLEGVFLHWHTYGMNAMTPGITSLLSRREQMLGAATLSGASIRLLYECAEDCLLRLSGSVSSRWERRPLHARLLRHGPASHAARMQALLPPGMLAHQTLSLTLDERPLLCTGVGTRSLTHRQVGAIAAALALPVRTLKRSLLASCSSHRIETGAIAPELISPFLPPDRAAPLLALVLLPCREVWEMQEREVALSLSLWESLLLPLRCLRPLLRLYARRAYPQVRLIELGNTSAIDYFVEVSYGR